jgi:hypothetical protein
VPIGGGDEGGPDNLAAHPAQSQQNSSNLASRLYYCKEIRLCYSKFTLMFGHSCFFQLVDQDLFLFWFYIHDKSVCVCLSLQPRGRKPKAINSHLTPSCRAFFPSYLLAPTSLISADGLGYSTFCELEKKKKKKGDLHRARGPSIARFLRLRTLAHGSVSTCTCT